MPDARTENAIEPSVEQMRTAQRLLPGGGHGVTDTADFEVRADIGCWAIASGRAQAGRASASRVAIDAVLQCARRSFDLATDAVRGCMLDAGVERATARHGHRTLGLGAMGTALALLVSDTRAATWASVGDLRVFHFQHGRLAGRGGRRSAVESEPRLHREMLAQGDVFLLCNPSWWQHLTEPEMELDLAKSDAPSEWLEIIAHRVLRRATPDCDAPAIAVFL